MIVVGLDVHKHSLTAVAVDELGRPVAEHVGPVDGQVVVWARSLGEERLWAVEDCRHVTRGLEQALLGQGERLVRVPPRLTAPQRRRGRTRGKSDSIDALAVARAALQEPLLDGPRVGEETLRELKLLVDHRDDLVAERRRCQQRLRWHLHELDPTLAVPLGGLDRAVWLDPLGRQLARRCSARSARSTASQPTPNSPATPASHHSTPAPANTNATASTAAATANSTAPSTESPSPKAASTHPHAPTSSANKTKAKHAAKPSAASNANSQEPSTQPSKTSPY